MTTPNQWPVVFSRTTMDAYRAIMADRVWVTATWASAAVRRDGREQFAAVALLVWWDMIGLRVLGMRGVPIATLLARFDAYTDDGVWDVIAADSDVTGDELHHAIATHAQQLARHRRAAAHRPGT